MSLSSGLLFRSFIACKYRLFLCFCIFLRREVCLLRHFLGQLDLIIHTQLNLFVEMKICVERYVALFLHTRTRRDMFTDDDVLLEAYKVVYLALDRRLSQHLGRLLEGGG